MAAIYRRRRNAELNSQESTQGCNTLRLTYSHSHWGSAVYIFIVLFNNSISQLCIMGQQYVFWNILSITFTRKCIVLICKWYFNVTTVTDRAKW